MSHKKRASTAFKSIGAAGLAAATIVSGLSFGAPTASAASIVTTKTPSERAGARATDLGQVAMVWKSGSSWYAITRNQNNDRVPTAFSTESEAKRAASLTWKLQLNDDGTFRFVVGDRCATDRYDSDTYRAYLFDTRIVCGQGADTWKLASGGKIQNTETNRYVGPVASFVQENGRPWYAMGTGSGYQFPGITDLVQAAQKRALDASITKVNNIARTAVVSGTATPKATVSIGSKSVTVDDDGKWSMTVEGLKDGANDLIAIQKIDNVEHDRKTVTVTIVDGGTLVGVDQGPVELTRGESAEVPFLVQNNETRTNMVGSVTLTAPEGTTFDAGQTTVAVGYRSGTSGDFKPYTKLDLKDGVRSDDGRTMTFTLNTDGGNMVTGEQYRYILKVTAADDAAAGSGEMAFVYAGDSSKGDFRAQGKTTTTIDTAVVDLTAKVDSVDHSAKSAVISGTATPGAKVSVGSQEVDADTTTGAWSMTITNLDSGANPLHVVQTIDGTEHDAKDLEVVINDAAISGQDGAPVTLERDAETSVEALFKTNGSISRPQGTVEFTAPEGTTFAAGQNTINGSYKVPGDEWTNTAMTLSNGVRSEDGTKYTYDFRTTTSTWNLPGDSLMRWNISVNTPADAEAGTPSMSTKLVGTATEGAFNTTSTTQTTIENAEAPAPAPLVVTSPENGSAVDVKRPVFSGTGDEGATIEVRGKSGRLVATATVENGTWSAPAGFDLNDNVYTLDVFQTPLQGSQSQTEVTFRVATNPLTTELTAVGAFDPDDVTKPATISGDATTGATVIVKDSLGNEVGRVEAKDGGYTIPVPPSFAHTGVNDFTVTQTKNGQTSPAKDVSLDYGTPQPIRITSPANGSTVQKQGLTFTGTGDEDARIDVRGNVRAIATGTVKDGTWTAPVIVDLSNNVYDLRAVQTTKGGLTTQAPITITITDEAPVAPLTATAAFNATDENLPATMTGTANPGATVTVKTKDGQLVGSAVAINGSYTITIPADKARFGVNEFTVTQTVKGEVSPALERSLDYGNPAAPVITSPDNGATVTNGSIRFTGTGATGAKLDMRGNTSSIGDTKITDGAWTVDVTRQLNPNVYALHALQTSKGGLTQRTDITVTVQNEAPVAPLTATAAFNATDENLPATMTGTANPGATVTVKTKDGQLVGSAVAINGSYTITIPADKARFGVNEFTVTQTVKGEVSPALERSLDYGNPAAPVITSPDNGATVTNGSIRFTGTGATGAKLDMRGNTSSIGDTKITDGAWTVDVTRQLNPNVYALHALQTSKGGLTQRTDITVVVRNEQITDLTATGEFPKEVEQEAFITGKAQNGADVIVKEGSTVIKSVKAVDSAYTVQVPATVSGERTFTVTQTIKGKESAPKTVILDYGTPAALSITSPANGGIVPGNQIVFTGTGEPEAKVVLNGTVSRLGSATVNDEGSWSITVDRTLRPQDYTLFTKQITKGNLNGPADQRTITVTQ
ncbi:Ig-like domain-containing protein [Curtobacterium sp. MCJR17_020]|uniref:Ig-like domain-containing protein n=1 Tax=Curtobacterium sp. MCJR17_020 TaxID=2175619 RepID=UPI0024DFFE81|nr:Ig-like domain-containing protein [Curtobacterium sp. MCJR17_020]WIE72652.1 Ig-like domain-containing protein [Curtobacterium sp. MCJR17_020]